MARTSRSLLFIVSLLLTVLSLSHSTTTVGFNPRRATQSNGGGSTANTTITAVDCDKIVWEQQCSKYPTKCRWCRSQSLDDTCFSASESRRLPPQVFSCH